MKIIYYPEHGNNHYPFSSKEECLKYEESFRKKELEWKSIIITPKDHLEKLILNLETAMTIPLGTIATCTFESLQIKGMVRVCQEFAEENKKYLSYY